MATRGKAAEQPVAPKLQLTPAAIERGIARLGERIVELRAFNVGSVPDGNSPELTALSTDIKDTLERCFGENTSAYRRFQSAAHLQFRPMMFGENYPQRRHYQDGARENIAQSIVLLESAQRALQQDLEDAQHEAAASSDSSVVTPSALSRRVFVVHGHDGEAREMVARFLKAMDFDPVILHEQANQGGTVIEKFEANSDVGFAVVLLTPDDLGRSLKEAELKPRARQNVLLELGYFIGRLGRNKVCALKRGDVELPSDYVGVVWEKMDDGGGWKLALARELKAAGHEVDLNKAFSL
ncbi:nucleotide-binding protein [Burkholderia vietnamiensis]|uniref:nucleotide-binding protein n=1 Tax=Burkholderia vietnamiensis TaxID=60552 RepID=UPI00264E9533|nr:nucleotide-binding protein [Burkholderia vietnamiensis]MDN7820898.1 nucleotide-binding protein [Burkholderia vietnamiensis]